MIVPILGAPDPCHPDAFIEIDAVPAHHVEEGADPVVVQGVSDVFGAQERKEFLPILLRHVLIGIARQLVQVVKHLAWPQGVVDPRNRLIADAVVFVQVDIVEASIV